MAPALLPVESLYPDVEDEHDQVNEEYSGDTSGDQISIDESDDEPESAGEEKADDDDDDDDDDGKTVSSGTEDGGTALKDISFGALAKAQASFVPNPRKRKLAAAERSAESIPDLPRVGIYHDRAKKPYKEPPAARTSKHAPTVKSSRHAVTRRREIFEPSPALKSRDPRFDATVNTSGADRTAVDRANKNYAFLSSYQATEVLNLKAQIKKTKDPEVAAALKRQAMSIESKIRSAEARQREKDILRQHKEGEKEAIKSGQKAKPYYLKQSDVRKEALTQKFNSMNKKARDKAVERKRKRVKGKESKEMPRSRRDRDWGLHSTA